MALVLTSGPALEPVTVAEAKAHLRIDDDAEDILVSSLILTSRLHIEAALSIALITQSWRLLLDRWPKRIEVGIPLKPLQTIDAIRVRDADGNAEVVPPADYMFDTASLPPRLVQTGSGWPMAGQAINGIEIDFTAGYGAQASDVPEPIRQALLLLAAHWYEHRDPSELGSPGAAIPDAVSMLLKPFRKVRL